ncbi:MAG: hypothetical protein M4579_002510 [Chaenotheca gracillima]|nr:MAG: hypothetical protein M4579_002510 [Chaenotheca gracillima]
MGLRAEHLATPDGTRLAVNDGTLEPDDVTTLRPSDPSLPIEELRKRYKEDGYLFLKGILPREAVLKAREEYFNLMVPTGLLEEGTKPVQGVFSSIKSADEFPGIGAGAAGGNGRPGGESAAHFIDLALEAHYKDWYTEDLCRHPKLLDFVSNFTSWGEKTLPLRRTLLRNNVPGTKPIGVHYDQIFLRHGEPTSVTAWVPIGDIKLSGGGLIYLENSEPIGLKLEEEFTKNARESGMTEEEARNAFNNNMMSTGLISEKPAQFAREHNRRWLVSDYSAGDVVLHQPHMIHASTINEDPEKVIRLATDLRFCDSSKPYDKRWTNYYEVGDGV